MKRVFLLFVMLLVAFPFLPACSGGDKPSAEEQDKRLEETQAAMDKGMEAMKDVKK